MYIRASRISDCNIWDENREHDDDDSKGKGNPFLTSPATCTC